MPSVLGQEGVTRVLVPEMSREHRNALQRSANTLKNALAQLKD
jgi:malate/lactate dehydrogenase